MTLETLNEILKRRESKQYILIRTDIAISRGINGTDFLSYTIGKYHYKTDGKEFWWENKITLKTKDFIKVKFDKTMTEYRTQRHIGYEFVPLDRIVSIAFKNDTSFFELHKSY